MFMKGFKIIITYNRDDNEPTWIQDKAFWIFGAFVIAFCITHYMGHYG